MSAQVLSIHDLSGNVLGFDLVDVLDCIDQANTYRWRWFIPRVPDAIGRPNTSATQRICSAIEKGRQGIWLTSDELHTFAKETLQVIDGQFIAFSSDAIDAGLSDRDFEPLFFPTNKMECIIEAVDSSFYIIYLKSEAYIQAIRQCFREVRDENPDNYFDHAL